MKRNERHDRVNALVILQMQGRRIWSHQTFQRGNTLLVRGLTQLGEKRETVALRVNNFQFKAG